MMIIINVSTKSNACKRISMNLMRDYTIIIMNQQQILHAALPSPFLLRSDAYSALGFDRLDVECIMLTTEQPDEVLREFLVYAQARSRGRPWSATGVYNDADAPLSLTSVLVEFEAHHHHDDRQLLRVQYVLPVTEAGALYSHSEGFGLLWLEFMRVCAFCPTQAEAVHAIDALAAASYYVEIMLREVLADRDRLDFFWHRQACLALEEGNGGGDPVRARALRQKGVGLPVPH